MDTAIVGVLGALIGVLLSNAMTMLLDVRRRRERIKDVQTSLRAEIRSHWRRLGHQDLAARAELIVRRMTEAAKTNQSYAPFIPREDRNIIFDALTIEINILPNDVIDPVVLYYTQINAISHFSEDLRGEQFKLLDAKRRIEMYEDYIAMKEQARDFAEEAIRALDRSLASGQTQ
jgi:hypothetical protein